MPTLHDLGSALASRHVGKAQSLDLRAAADTAKKEEPPTSANSNAPECGILSTQPQLLLDMSGNPSILPFYLAICFVFLLFLTHSGSFAFCESHNRESSSDG